MSWRYRRVRTWTSEFLATAPQSLFLGDMVTGALSASYGGIMAAILDTRKLTTMDEWAALDPYEVPLPTTDFDTYTWTLGALPELGGCAFYCEGNARLAAVRIAPPPTGPHTSHRRRLEEAEKTKREGATIRPPFPTDCRKSSRRREARGEYCAQYKVFRAKTDQPEASRVHYRYSDRGRPRPRRNRDAKSPRHTYVPL